MDPSPDVERVLAELNEAMAEPAGDAATPDAAYTLDADRRRQQRRSVVPDRRMGERRNG